MENMMRSLQQSQTRLSRIYLQSVLLHRVLLLAHVSETSIKQVTRRETRGFYLTAKESKADGNGNNLLYIFYPKTTTLV